MNRPQFSQRPQQPQQMPPQQHHGGGQRPQADANDFLMGGGIPSASFLKIGDSVSGTITEPPFMQQQRDIDTGAMKFWENGDPMMHMVVTLQTDQRDPKIDDDDGRRRVYVKFNMRTAVREACKKAGAKDGLAVGGKLTITFTEEGEAERRGMNPPKFYAAEYVPPAGNFLSQGDRGETSQGAGGATGGNSHAQNATYEQVHRAFLAKVQNNPNYADQKHAGNVFRGLMAELFPQRRPSEITAAEWGTAVTAINDNFDPSKGVFVWDAEPNRANALFDKQQFKDDDIPF